MSLFFAFWRHPVASASFAECMVQRCSMENARHITGYECLVKTKAIIILIMRSRKIFHLTNQNNLFICAPVAKPFLIQNVI